MPPPPPDVFLASTPDSLSSEPAGIIAQLPPAHHTPNGGPGRKRDILRCRSSASPAGKRRRASGVPIAPRDSRPLHDKIWTCERLATEAGRLARGLSARGVGPVDRFALHMVNRARDARRLLYACFEPGAIAAPLRTAFIRVQGIRRLGRSSPSARPTN